MPRLRTLLITETDETGRTRTRDILILDGIDPEQAESLGQAGPRPEGIPSIIGLPFEVDLPQTFETTELDGAPDEALIALGWTPPADGQE